MPHWVLAELNTLYYNFFWSGKKDLVARAVVCPSTDCGGFSVVNITYDFGHSGSVGKEAYLFSQYLGFSFNLLVL